MLKWIVALLLMASPALADTIRVQVPNVGALMVLMNNVPGPTSTGSFTLPAEALFDSSLGTLESVRLRYQGSMLVSTTVDVQELGTYGALGEADLVLTGSSGPLASFTRQIAFDGRTVTEPGPNGFSAADSETFDFDLTSNLGMFITGGALDLSLTGRITVSRSEVIYSGPGEFSTSGGLRSYIDYTYTPIPEPGTALLLGLGLIGLAARRQ